MEQEQYSYSHILDFGTVLVIAIFIIITIYCSYTHIHNPYNYFSLLISGRRLTKNEHHSEH